jgi:hypothetical protein
MFKCSDVSLSDDVKVQPSRQPQTMQKRHLNGANTTKIAKQNISPTTTLFLAFNSFFLSQLKPPVFFFQ